MPTANYSIAPEDGWTLIATAPKYARVSAFPHTAPYYIAASATLPAATVTGQLVSHHPVVVNVTMTENLYARTVKPATDGQKTRIDVLTI